MHLRYYIYAALTFVALSIQAEVSVTTYFEPSRIKMSEKARYVIRLEETDTQKMPKMEPIEGLQLQENMGGLRLSDGRIRGRGTTYKGILGGPQTYSDSFEVVIDATATRTGTFTIPEHSFTYKGETHTAPAATLTVVERTAPDHPPTENNVRLVVDAPKELYAGERTQITVKLFIYTGLGHVQYSQLNSSAPDFVFKADDENAFETSEVVQGWEYQVVNWPVEITPIKSGELSLNFEVIVSQMRHFGMFSRNRDRFPVYSDPTLINVSPLPQQGQPKSFSGAIGDFTINVFADQQETSQGEPIMLSFTVDGRGNFERIGEPLFEESDEWRSYSPETSFEPKEQIPIGGSKRYDYIFIPQTTGELELPEIAFSYFNPETAEYVELTSPGISVSVTEAQNATLIAPAVSASPSQDDPQLKRTLTGEEALLMLDYIEKEPRPVQLTVFRQPTFYAVNALFAGVALCGTIMTLRKRKLLENEDYRRAKEAEQMLKQVTQDLRTAAKENNSETFYRETQRAIRICATKRTGRDFATASVNQLQEAFVSAGIDEDTRAEMVATFEGANAALYSKQIANDTLEPEMNKTLTLLKKL